MRCRREPTIRTAALAGLALLAACASRPPGRPIADGGAAIQPALAVERFLSAANALDLQTMARLFGTADGSVFERDPPEEVEKRMFALASVLRHDDYTLQGEFIAPGRLGQAVRIIVGLRIGGQNIPVPFTVVRTERSDWLVEQIDVSPITGGD